MTAWASIWGISPDSFLSNILATAAVLAANCLLPRPVLGVGKVGTTFPLCFAASAASLFALMLANGGVDAGRHVLAAGFPTVF